MPIKVAFHGYESKSQYIVAKWEQGLSLKDIHRESGIRYATVVQAVSVRRAQNNPHLTKAASRRKLTMHELTKQLLDVIERDNLVDAILDDLDKPKHRMSLPS